ncbi:MULTISPECIES: MFS transporter [Pseudomonas]|jgi:MHS family alpha-ketoglutarate permease-like MFS transporter|uniref:MFS transporter n=1 Tax=Pseudomonas psychrophila TaxID=122355 RepID=A0A8I1FQI3_9PSED|nr:MULTISPECIES: MFS transporter [Pseudomonas]EPJ92415.1 dicarboxylate MFS transporter [Pseudomonas psychrophila]KAB0493403.1 MFS transporter [Pseudomonas psychrophila]KMN02723.1 MFS transporter [Pseudomonas psychrophila]KOX66406.1 MFS transporter [Pseudomonas psychrophila]MBJ2255176.1 MFS transporter [Pseudomonas psychrophila]
MDNSSTLPAGSVSAAPKEKTTSSRIKSIFSGSVGNMVEWYDWYVYAAFSLYFAKAFFPKGDTTAQLLNTAAIFAVGFLMRPIGGWLMGLYADRKGRKAALMASVLLMCFGSLVIALSPGYETIGVWAPVLLVFARLLQGLSVGGEYGTSATYLSEMATKERRGFFSSFQYVTLISGQLIALGVLIVLQQTLTEEQLYSWGWRVPFVIGALCAVVALYLRRGMEETESFKKAKVKPKESAMRTLMRHPKELMTVVGLTMGGTLAFYTYTTYMQKYLVNTVGMSISDSTTISAATLFLFMCIQPLVGALSDKIGRRPILIAFGVLGTLFTVPILTTLHTITTWWGAFFLIMAALIIVSGYTSINAVVKAELFPTEIRALGVGLPYALTVSIFGGTAEYIALWFKSAGMETGYYWYVTACIACSLAVYATMKDTRKHSRIETD